MITRLPAGRYSAAALPIELYHTQCTDRPSISASGLKQIADCPARFWAFSELNPNRFERPPKKAFDIGKASHALTLSEPEFNAYFIISPFESFRTKAAQEWRDAQTKTVLTAEEFSAVKAMAGIQRSSPVVMQAFVDGEPEVSFIFVDQETGVHLKSRPDWMPRDPTLGFVVDFKTCRTIEPRQLSTDSFRFGYHIQASLQVDAVASIMGVKPLGIAHVVQEKDPPYLADLRMFSPESLDYGRLIYRKALRTFANCMASGKWPSYTECAQYFETPPWVARQMEEFDGNDGHYDTNEPAYTGADYLAAP